MDKILYIAYGSNLNRAQMAHRCPTAKVIGKAKLTGYWLLFRGGKGNAVATVEKKKGNSVPVLVWELELDDEAALDIYEGVSGGFYRKEYLKIKINGKQQTALIYIMNDGRPLGEPSRFYYETILQGYKDAGFEIEILEAAVKKSVD